LFQQGGHAVYWLGLAEAHKIQGAVVSVGAMALSALAFEIEQAGKARRSRILAPPCGGAGAELFAIEDGDRKSVARVPGYLCAG
jgi:HPt (histidine-containing phosphotransfer) domain-containing protein